MKSRSKGDDIIQAVSRWIGRQFRSFLCMIRGGHIIQTKEMRPEDSLPWVENTCKRCDYKKIVALYHHKKR